MNKIIKNDLTKWIILICLLTPWFWHLSIPNNLLNWKISEDITRVHQNVQWQRGKLNPSNSIFLNWPLFFIGERMNIVFENLDIGNYFFAGHPRERVGVLEKQKFFFFEFILFLIGLTNSEIRKYFKFLAIYLSLVLTATFLFKWRDFSQTIFMSVPLILIMAQGAQKLAHHKKWIILISSLAILEIAVFNFFYFKGLIP